MATSAAARPAVDGVEIPVRLVRQQRARFASAALQDVPAAIAILVAGVAGVRAPRGATDLALAVAELAVAAWVLLFTVRGAAEAFGRGGTPATEGAADDALAPPATARPRVRWEGVAAGALALVEVWHHWHTTGRINRPTLTVGVSALVLALGGAAAIERRTAHRRPRLLVSREGLHYRGSRRLRFEARWDEVARLEEAPGLLRVVRHDGREWTLRARAHVDGATLVAAACRAVRAHAPSRLACVPAAVALGGEDAVRPGAAVGGDRAGR